MYGIINVELFMKFLCLATIENKNSKFASDICPERSSQASYPREVYTPEECLAPGSYDKDLEKITNMVVDIDFLLDVIKNQSNCDICSTVECNREAEEILSYLNEKVSPCDDFYEFACGGWLKKHTVHEEEPHVSVYSELENHIQISLKNMLGEKIRKKNPDYVRKIKGIYRSCMDVDRLSKTGSEQLKEAVRGLEKWPIIEGEYWDYNSFDWMDTLIKLRQKGFSHNTLISLSVVEDPDNNMTNIIELGQPPLGIDRDSLTSTSKFYKRDDYFELIRKAAYLLRSNESSFSEFSFASSDPYFETITDVLAFEKRLAELFSPVKQRKKYTIQQLREEVNEIDWFKYFNGVLSDKIYGNESLIIDDINYIKEFARAINAKKKREVANYMFWRVIHESLPLLSKEWRTLNNRPEQLAEHQPEVHEDQPRWKQCLDFVMDNFDIAVNSYYMRRYFKGHIFHDIEDMFDFIQYIVRAVLMKNTWKDQASEQMATEKASAMKMHISYPKTLLFDSNFSSLYSDLKLNNENYFEKVLKMRKWSTDNALSLRINPSHRYELELRRLFEQYANGSSAKIIYNYGKNRIEVPTGILQKAFFKENRPQSLNWGAIGSLIAQKVTNAFFYEGQPYDSRGRAVGWWRPSVTEDFKNKESCFRRQYRDYLQNGNGTNLEVYITEQTQQYITTTAGLKAAYLAYNISATSEENEFLPGLAYTPNQLFWISAAQVMCEKQTKEYAEERLHNVKYLPAKFRVIGAVSNLPQFAQDFNCPLDAPMNPESKCKLW